MRVESAPTVRNQIRSHRRPRAVRTLPLRDSAIAATTMAEPSKIASVCATVTHARPATFMRFGVGGGAVWALTILLLDSRPTRVGAMMMNQVLRNCAPAIRSCSAE